MHKRLHYLLIWVILIYVNVPGIGQINPIKAPKDLGKSVPEKRDPAPSNPNTSRVILYSITIVRYHTGAGKYGTSKHYADGILADKFLCENAK